MLSNDTAQQIANLTLELFAAERTLRQAEGADRLASRDARARADALRQQLTATVEAAVESEVR